MNRPPVSLRRSPVATAVAAIRAPIAAPIIATIGTIAAATAALAGCQGKSEPDPPRPPPAVIEARSGTTTLAHVVAGHPCRAEIEGDEFLIGTMPLVTQIGASRWTGDDSAGDGTTLRKDGAAIIRIRDAQDAAIEVFDPAGAAILRLSSDGAIANGAGEVLRRAEATRTAIKIGDTVITGTSDLALGALVTAPELIPEVRGLAACHRLLWHEQRGRAGSVGAAEAPGRK